MIRAYARFIANRSVALAIVVVTLALVALAGWQARRVGQDDDILAFLPRTNADVASFHTINERFGGLDVAIVGITAEDAFDAEFLTRLRRATKALNENPLLSYTLSLTNVEDFAPEKGGGIRADYLVSRLPTNDAEAAALRELAMSKDHIVGNLVSKDGKSVILYSFAHHGANPRAVASTVREAVLREFPNEPKFWGGAPFISTYIFDITQDDMRRLMPWAVAVILAIVMWSFRDVVGVLLMLLATGMGIVFSYGLMGARGVNANIVLGSMPVVLFALGSAYATHVMVAYYSLRHRYGAEEAITKALERVVAPVIGAGLTTVAGMFSFLSMDIVPMQDFGLYSGLGVLSSMFLALTFVPAVVVLYRPNAKSFKASRFNAFIVQAARAIHQKKRPLLVVVAGLAALGAAFAGRIEARMDTAAFFSEESPPATANRFLRENFGGSQFIQIGVDGDMNDPDVLREVQRVADAVSLIEHVTSVIHIGDVLSMTYESMVGERRLPATSAQARLLYRFLAGRSSVTQLVTEDRQHALLQVKIDSDEHDAVTRTLGAVEAVVRDSSVTSYRVVGRSASAARPSGEGAAGAGAADATTELAKASAGSTKVSDVDRALAKGRMREVVAARLVALLHTGGIAAPDPKRLVSELERPATKPDEAKVKQRIEQFLASEESVLDKAQRDLAAPIARAVAKLGKKFDDDDLTRAIALATGRSEEDDLVDDVSLTLGTAIDEAWRQEQGAAQLDALVGAAGIDIAATPQGERLRRRMADALIDLEHPSALAPVEAGAAQGTLAFLVSGVPVLHRGLSASVTSNQIASLISSCVVVFVILCVMFRSVTAGLIGVAPTALTLLLIYGAMKALGIYLDIGTSMLASIIVGEGVDYTAQLMAGWHAREGEPLGEAAAASADEAGLGIWTNALMVGAGFFVLTLGEARPLRNVGGLTAAAMLVAAAASFVVVPVLARKRRYPMLAVPPPDASPSPAREPDVAPERATA